MECSLQSRSSKVASHNGCGYRRTHFGSGEEARFWDTSYTGYRGIRTDTSPSATLPKFVVNNVVGFSWRASFVPCEHYYSNFI